MKYATTMAALLTALALGAFAVGGCGGPGKKASDKIVEKAIESSLKAEGKDAQVKVDSASGAMSIKTKKDGEDVDVKVEGDKVSMKSRGADGATTYEGSGDSFTMTSDDGTTTFSSGKGATLPASFPKDVAVYPGATLEAVIAQSGEDKGFSITATTPDAPEKVAAFHKKELTAQGWTEKQSLSQTGDAPMQMLVYTKDARQLTLIITRDGEVTRAALNIGAQ